MNNLILIFLLLSSYIFSQNDKLFYFIENDSLVGVKNQKNEIIIPAEVEFSMYFYRNNNEEIKEPIITFYKKNEGFKVFNRKGEFLYNTYIFDSGPDDFNEGFQRFVENKKMGLANVFGEKIIEAKYDWISTPNFGYIKYCNGCYFDREKDDEHPPLIGGIWGYLDKNGNEIELKNKRNNNKDIEIKKGKFLPYQFKYNNFELEILSFFEKRKPKIAHKLNINKNKICFEIVENPNQFYNFYRIKLYEFDDNIGYYNLHNDNERNYFVSENSTKFFLIQEDYIDESENKIVVIEKEILIDDWLKN